MPIKIKNAPSKNFNELKSSAQFFHKGEINTDEKGDHHQYIPHKIYDASVSDLAEGKEFSNVVQTGWRYIFQDPNGVYHVAEIGMDEELDEHKFHHVNSGGHVNSFVAIYNLLHKHEHVEEKHYKINILRISPIYVMAIWLKGADHDHEFFIPIAPVNRKFEAGKTYEYKAFMKLLQEAAQEVVGIPAVEADLARIEGIGPKLADIFKAAGYTTFQSLAAASVGDLKKVLKEAGAPYSMFDPTTWPEQAKLADEGNWEAFDKLADELKSGRR